MANPKKKPDWLVEGEERVRQLRELAARKHDQIEAEREAEERRRAQRRRFLFWTR